MRRRIPSTTLPPRTWWTSFCARDFLFAYGQTGTGKTHTIFGPAHSRSDINHEDAGIFPRAVSKVLAFMKGRKAVLCASAMEFYMCQCTDLMDDNAPCVIDENHMPVGLKAVEISSKKDSVEFMANARNLRHTMSTLMNQAIIKKTGEADHEGSSRRNCSLILLTLATNDRGEVEKKMKTNQKKLLPDHLARRQACILWIRQAQRGGVQQATTTNAELRLSWNISEGKLRIDIATGGQGFIVNYELFGLRDCVVQAAEAHRKKRKLAIPKANTGTSFQEYTSACFTGSMLLTMIVNLSPALSCGWKTWFSCTYGEDLCCPVKPQSVHLDLGKLLKELIYQAEKSAHEVAKTPTSGPGNKYMARRVIKVRHDTREVELWQKLEAFVSA
ncbi:unnamed protein product [Amoebophrya sp. A25]|nr:unnamed protein product [Amoebophrya sp. A25]|eukprot:GSA25T00000425001.1